MSAFGEDWRIFSVFFSVCRFVDSICWTNNAYTCKYYLSNIIESTNLQIEKWSFFNVYLSSGQNKSLFSPQIHLRRCAKEKKTVTVLSFFVCWWFVESNHSLRLGPQTLQSTGRHFVVDVRSPVCWLAYSSSIWATPRFPGKHVMTFVFSSFFWMPIHSKKVDEDNLIAATLCILWWLTHRPQKTRFIDCTPNLRTAFLSIAPSRGDVMPLYSNRKPQVLIVWRRQWIAPWYTQRSVVAVDVDVVTVVEEAETEVEVKVAGGVAVDNDSKFWVWSRTLMVSSR